jgi:trypsin-like peptidase
MKRLPIAVLSLFAILLSLTGCGAVTSALPKVPLSTPALVAHEGYSTVALVRYDEDNQDDKVSEIKPYCSAVWVDETHILTAHHCVKSIQEEMQDKQDEKEKNPPQCSLIAKLFGACDDTPPAHKTIYLKDLPIHFVQWKEVDDVGKEPTAWHLSHVVGWDEHKDLALLEAAGNAIPSHEYAKLADKTPGLTEAVHVCGHPKGLYWTFLEGTVAGYRGEIPHMDKKAGPFMQVQTPIYFGNSGGGAFNNYGELVGIADFLMKVPAEGFFVHLDNIRAFLQDQNLLDKPEPKEAKKVVGVAPHEDASPDPRKDDATKGDPLQGIVTPPAPQGPAPKALPQPNFHIPSLPPGLKPLFPPGQ